MDLKSVQSVLVNRFKNNLFLLKNKGILDDNTYRFLVNFQAQRYKIGFNEKKIPDILDTLTNTPLYSYNMESICSAQIKNPPIKVFTTDFNMQEMPTTQKILNETIFKNDYQPNDFYAPKFYPFLMLYGIGSGVVLEKIIQHYYVKHLFVYEPNTEFFYLSLYFIDFKEIFKTLEKKGISLSLNFNLDDESLLERSLQNFLSQNLISSTYLSVFIHYQTPNLEDFFSNLSRIYNTFFNGWWFFDHIKRELTNSLKNLNGKSKVLLPTNVLPQRVFIVASGPSLDDSLNFLKSNQDKAIIVACGTAIKALVEAGIKCDFYIHLDPIYETLEYVDKTKLKDITLLTHDNIVPQVKKYFKKIIYFFRHDSITRALYAIDKAVYNANPTVTNAAVSLFLALHAQEIYLFGVDLGTKGSKAHAKNTVYTTKTNFFETDKDVESSYIYKVPSNLNPNQFVYTNAAFALAKRQLEDAISHYAHTNTKIYNCSNGAKIYGPNVIAADQNHLDLEPIDKNTELNKINNAVFYSKYCTSIKSKDFLISNLKEVKKSIVSMLKNINSIESFEKATKTLHDELLLSEENLIAKNYLLFVRLDVFLILQKCYSLILHTQKIPKEDLINATESLFSQVENFILNTNLPT